VAIKVTRCDTAKKDHIFESMKKEILILSSCHHPNIVNYVSSFYYDNMLWVWRHDVFDFQLAYFTHSLGCHGILWWRNSS